MKFPGEKSEKPVVIVIKGLPFTGREQFSIRIAEWVNCPIFSVYGVLKVLSEEKGYSDTSSRVPSEEEAESLERQAISILCNMAKVNLRCHRYFTPQKSIKCVVIDFPLSSTYQLDQLVEIFTSFKLIIIECRVKNKSQWRLRFNRGGSHFVAYMVLADDEWRNHENQWFVPKCWEDAERAIQAYDAQAWHDCFHYKCNGNRRIKWLVLDPERDLSFFELDKKDVASPFAEALRYLLTDKQASSFIELDQWRKQQMLCRAGLYIHPDEKSTSLCKNGDCLLTYEDHLEQEATCMACDKKLTRQAYICHFCTLGLHKSCAEFHSCEPKVLYGADLYGSYTIQDMCRFPKVYACKSCEESSLTCASCIMKTHLKCRRMPTIVNDDGHEHILSIRLAHHESSSEHVLYNCQACGEPGCISSYSCIICNFSCHPRCATLPRELEHQHGGYNHHMKLKYSCQEEEEDYWCDVCFKDMDPECWFYSCQECPYYVAHLLCVMVKPEHKKYLPPRLRIWPGGL